MEYLSIFLIIAQILVLLFCIVEMIRIVDYSSGSVPVIYYSFGLTGFLVSDFYWFAYEFMYPNTRLPFAVNEVGEWAGLLLLSVSLTTLFKGEFRIVIHEIFIVSAFTAISVILWIAWSGEWFEDIISGLVCGYFFCVVVLSMLLTDVLTKKQWISFTLLAWMLIICQILTFYVPEDIYPYVDGLCYTLMITGIIGFVIELLKKCRRHDSYEKRLTLAFGGAAWGISSMYMSSGLLYCVMIFGYIVMIPVITISLKKVVKSYDIC